MGITTNDPQLADIAARYGRIVAYSYFTNSLVMVYVAAQRSAENPHFGLAVLSVSMVLNVALNWALIFGKFGLPAMGVEGSALATLLARAVEILITLLYILFIDKRLRIRLRAFLRPGMLILKDYIRYATPVVVNETMWGFGTSLYPVIYGHMAQASDIVAAYSIAGNVDKIISVAIFAVAHSTAIIIGKKIGSGARKEDVYAAGKWLLRISVAVGVLAGLCIALIAGAGTGSFLFTLFKVTPNAQRVALDMLLILAAATLFRYMNTVIIVGILRGGGDVKAGMFIDIMTMYLYALPAAALSALLFKADISLVYTLIVLEECVKTFIGLWRFRSRKWILDITREIAV
jgi:putative MATE family efflux protein